MFMRLIIALMIDAATSENISNTKLCQATGDCMINPGKITVR